MVQGERGDGKDLTGGGRRVAVVGEEWMDFSRREMDSPVLRSGGGGIVVHVCVLRAIVRQDEERR